MNDCMNLYISGFGGISQSAPGVMYLGNFIVRKDLRRKGIGRLIWKAMLERAGNQNIVLDGGSKMGDWYTDHGFPFHTFKILFHLVTVTMDMKKSIQSKYETTALSDDMWPSLMEYDKYVYTSFDRERILRAWFAGDKVRVVIAKDAGEIVGYGSIHRMPHNHYGIRNVFADNEAVIETILHDMLADLPEGTTVHFTLVDGKPLPKYIQHSVYLEETAQRMFSKFKIETNTDKMWLATAHVL